MEIAPFVPNIVERGFFEVNPIFGYVLVGLVISLMMSFLLYQKNKNNPHEVVEATSNIFAILALGLTLIALMLGTQGVADYLDDDENQYKEQKSEYISTQMKNLEDKGIDIMQGEIPANYNTREESGSAVSMVLKTDGKIYDCLVSYPENLEDNLVFSCSPLTDMKLEDIMAGK